MKNKVIIKRMAVMLLVILLILGGINLFWYLFKYRPYKLMSDRMQFNDDPEMPRYVTEKDGFVYRLKLPPYLSFESGFLYAAPLIQDGGAEYFTDAEGNLTEKNIPHSDLFIWPRMFSEAKYGVTVYEETSSMQLMTNRKGEYLPDPEISEAEREEEAEMFRKHQSEIQELIQASEELWGDVLR